MALPTLYPAQTNSPGTTLANMVIEDDTTVVVEDASVLPTPPNLLVIGTETDAETVLMTAKAGNSLTVQRGIEGTPRAWDAGEFIARNFTAKDQNDLQASITEILALRGAANGIATLDANSLLTTSQMNAPAWYKKPNATASPDLDTIIVPGEYPYLIEYNAATHGPAANGIGYLTVYSYANEYGVLQVLKPYRTTYDGYYVRSRNDGNWGAWQRINTTPAVGYGPLTWYPMTLINGATGTLQYAKSNGNVYIYGVIRRNTTNASLEIAVIPVGYRPGQNYATGTVYNTGFVNNPVMVALAGTTGTLLIEQSTAGTVIAGADLFFYLTYYASF